MQRETPTSSSARRASTAAPASTHATPTDTGQTDAGQADAGNSRKPVAAASSWFDLFRNGLGVYTLTINLAMAMHAIDVFITAAVMPKVVKDIGGISFYTWPTTLYMVSSIVGAASNAPLRAIFGTRRAYILASLTFLFGSIGCALAPSMLIMLIARTVQGWGGGLLISLSMALVQSSYPERLRKRALAFISSTWGVAALLGPAVGGLFAEHGFWRGAFWFNVPIVAIFMAGAWIKLQRHSPEDGTIVPRFPYRRLAMLTVGVCAVSLAGEVYEGLSLLGIDPKSPSFLSIAIPLQIAFIVIAILAVKRTITLDRPGRITTSSRLLPSQPLSLVTSTGLGGWVMLISSMTHSVIGAYLPLALQVVRGTSDSVAAYIMACLAVAWTVASVGTSHFQGRNARACITIGLLLSTLGLIILTLTIQSGSLWIIAFADSLVGIGLGTTNLHLVAAVMRYSAKGEEGLTASSIPTIRSLGISFGAAGAGVIANSSGLSQAADAGSISTAIHWVLGVGCALPLIAALFAVFFVRLINRRGDTESGDSDAALADTVGPDALP